MATCPKCHGSGRREVYLGTQNKGLEAAKDTSDMFLCMWCGGDGEVGDEGEDASD